MNRKLCLAGWFLILAFGLSAPPHLQQASGQGKKTTQQELEELQRIVGVLNVTVSLQQNPTPIKGRLTGVTEFFGKRFLVLTRDGGQKTIINVDAIAAIQQQD